MTTPSLLDKLSLNDAPVRVLAWLSRRLAKAEATNCPGTLTVFLAKGGTPTGSTVEYSLPLSDRPLHEVLAALLPVITEDGDAQVIFPINQEGPIRVRQHQGP